MASSKHQAEALRAWMQRLVRRFGAMASDRTPCGQPLSMAHAHALMVLLERGALSQQELGRELCIDKSNVARLCARMAGEGHVTQRVDYRDARSRRVELTARGKQLARSVDRSSAARFEALLEQLSPEARERSLTALRDLVHAVENLPAEGVAIRTSSD